MDLRETTEKDLDKAERMPDLTLVQLVYMQMAKMDMHNPPSHQSYMLYIARLWSYLQENDPNYSLALKTTWIKFLEKNVNV